MIAGLDYDPSKADIWSAAVTLFHMLTGNLPFKEPSLRELYSKIINGEYKIPKFLSKESKNLLYRLLITDPSQRPTFEEILEDPFIRKYDFEDEKSDDYSCQISSKIILDIALQETAAFLKVDPLFLSSIIASKKKNGLTAQ